MIGGNELQGEVKIDGAYFGSRVRQPNRRADRRQQRGEDSKRRVVRRRGKIDDRVALSARTIHQSR